MNFAYVNEIVSQLLSNTFSVFCGAGASADITNSKWEDIFCETTRKFYHRKLSDDIYFLADLEKHYYNADHFFLRRTFRKILPAASGEADRYQAPIWLCRFLAGQQF